MKDDHISNLKMIILPTGENSKYSSAVLFNCICGLLPEMYWSQEIGYTFAQPRIRCIITIDGCSRSKLIITWIVIGKAASLQTNKISQEKL